MGPPPAGTRVVRAPFRASIARALDRAVAPALGGLETSDRSENDTAGLSASRAIGCRKERAKRAWFEIIVLVAVCEFLRPIQTPAPSSTDSEHVETPMQPFHGRKTRTPAAVCMGLDSWREIAGV